MADSTAVQQPGTPTGKEILEEIRENPDGSVTLNPSAEEEADDGDGTPAGGGSHDDDDDEDGAEGKPRTAEEGADADTDHDDPAHTEAERETVRARRRQERADKKNRAREREETLKRELGARDAVIESLTQRLSTVERKTTGNELVQLDVAINEATQAAQYFQNIAADAVNKQNGAAAVDATTKMMEARRRAEELTNLKTAHQRQAATPPVDTAVIARATEWYTKNKWYDPNGKDPDSKVAKAIDETMAAEGLNPALPGYYTELDARIAKYMPHRTAKGGTVPASTARKPPPRTPVSGSSQSSAGAGNGAGKSFTVSPERVQALKDAGMWDDPKTRADALRRFREYDKDAANSSRK